MTQPSTSNRPASARFKQTWLSLPAQEFVALTALSGFPYVRHTGKPPTAAQLATVVPNMKPATVGRVLSRLHAAGLVTRTRNARRDPYTYRLAGTFSRGRWELIPTEALALTPASFRAYAALIRARGNRSRAARLMGVSRRAVLQHVQAIQEAGWGVKLDDTRRCEARRHSSRARVPNPGFEVLQTKERSSDAGLPAHGAPTQADGNPERQPRTAPVTKRPEPNRTGSRRSEVTVSVHQRAVLAKVGFGDYRFESPEERDRIGGLAVEVAARPGRRSCAVVWGLKRAGQYAGLAARIQWAALGRGECVEVFDGRVLRACASCGRRFAAPMDLEATVCPACSAPSELARELAGAMDGTRDVRETADAERARQTAAFVRTPDTTPTHRTVAPPVAGAVTATGRADELRRRFAAMGEREAVA